MFKVECGFELSRVCVRGCVVQVSGNQHWQARSRVASPRQREPLKEDLSGDRRSCLGTGGFEQRMKGSACVSRPQPLLAGTTAHQGPD